MSDHELSLFNLGVIPFQLADQTLEEAVGGDVLTGGDFAEGVGKDAGEPGAFEGLAGFVRRDGGGT